ncbi:MAG TPA: hypothetical protein VL523_01465 [Terriglobia bacterium]|nr:hypothetical protein [Terriglobia bacterium]
MKTFNRSVVSLILAAAALGLVVSRAAGDQQAPQSKPTAGQVRVSKGGLITTVKGYVIDSSCTFRNHLKKPVSAECAVKCAKAGSPLVIQTADGVIYWPISADMPATSQNDKLMPYAGRMVTVTGTPYTKGGSRAIVIEKIEAAEGSQ